MRFRTPYLLALPFAAGAAFLAAQTSGPTVRGDVSGDGQITAVDALAVLSYSVGKPLPDGYTILPNGDTNGDGEVTAIDALIGLSYTVGKDVSQFPVGEALGAPVAIVTIDPDSAAVMVGSTLQLTATPRDSSNNALEDRAVTWASADSTVATVTSEGMVTGIALGDVQIVATSEGVSDTAAISIVEAVGTPEIDVSPNSATLLAGDTLQLRAVVRDGAGNPIAGREVTWSSADSTIAAVLDSGEVVGVGLGEVDVVATSGDLTGVARITVVASAAEVNRTWTGNVSSDWGTAENWEPVGAPGATDTLLIPASAATQPALNGVGRVAGIVIEDGARLDIRGHELQVSGRVDVDGEIVGSGLLYITGVNAGTSLARGTLPSTRIVGNTVLVSGTTINGSLTLDASSFLHVNRQQVHVSGDMRIEGTLLMQDELGLLNVRGSALFFTDQDIGRDNLTAGTLRVGGDFTAEVPPGVTSSPFTASDVHRLVLDGAAAQTVTSQGVGILEIQELDIENTAGGVRFEASTPELRIRVIGSFTDLTGTSIWGGGRVNVLRHLTTPAAGSLTLQNLAVRGTLAAAGHFAPDTLTLIGREQLIPGDSNYQYQNLTVAGSAWFGGNAGVAGGLTLGCFTELSDCVEPLPWLDLAGRDVVVGGDLRQTVIHPSTPLLMQDAAGALSVRGSVLAPDGSASVTGFYVADELWTTGALRVGGDLSLRGTGTVSSGATGTHSVTLDGAELQRLEIFDGFAFQALTIADSIGVRMDDPADVRNLVGVRGDFNISTAAELSGTGRIEVVGNVETATGSAVTVAAIKLGSVLRSSGAFSPDTAEFASGVAQTIPDGLTFRNVLVRGNASFGGDMQLDGMLEVLPGGSVNLSDRRITVTGALRVGGVLRMQRVEGLLVVGGDATFTHADDENSEAYATNGVLRVAGNVSGSRPGGFYPSVNHRVVLNGTEPRNVSGWFQHLEVGEAVAATIPAADTLNVRGTTTTHAGAALTVNGRLRAEGAFAPSGAFTMNGEAGGRATFLAGFGDVAGSEVTVPRLEVKGNLDVLGTVAPGRLVLLGGAVTAGAGIGGDVYVAGAVTPAGPVTIEGSLTIACDTLTLDEVACNRQTPPSFGLNGQTVNVNGKLLQTMGLLVMTNPGDVLAVRDSAVFGHVVRRNTFTDGVLRIGGHLRSTVVNGMGGDSLGPDSAVVFAVPTASGYDLGTTVVFDGSTYQNVTSVDPISNSTSTGIRFSNVEARNLFDAVTNNAGVMFGLSPTGQSGHHMVEGSLTVGSLSVQYNTYLEVMGNLTLVEGAKIMTNGVLLYHGNYAEEGEPLNRGQPRLAGLRSFRWVTQPTDRTAGERFDPVLELELLDASGARLLTGSASIDIPIGSIEYRGARRVVSVNGVARFDSLAVVKPGSSLRVVAGGYGLSGRANASSNSFNVVAGAPANIRFRKNDPALPAIVGPQSAGVALVGTTSFGDNQLVIEVTDSAGNLVPHTGTVTVIPGPGSPDTVVYGTPSFTLQNAASVLATDLKLQKNGVYTLIPTMDGLEGVPTDTFRINGGTASLGTMSGPTFAGLSAAETASRSGAAVRSDADASVPCLEAEGSSGAVGISGGGRGCAIAARGGGRDDGARRAGARSRAARGRD